MEPRHTGMTEKEFQAEVLDRFEKMDHRFEKMDQRFDDLEAEMREGSEDIKGLIAVLSSTVITVPKLRRELRERELQET